MGKERGHGGGDRVCRVGEEGKKTGWVGYKDGGGDRVDGARGRWRGLGEWAGVRV